MAGRLTMVLLLSLSPFLCDGTFLDGKKTVAPKYVINLDLPPEQRWTKVIQDYRPMVQLMRKSLLSRFPALYRELAVNVSKRMPAEFADEVRGIAKAANMTDTEGFLLNFIYELTAYCTSIIGQDTQGRIWHGRNFDYGWKAADVALFKNATIVVDFQRNGKTVYSGTTMAGYMGLPTAQKPGVFTLSINERDTGGFQENYYMAYIGGGQPMALVTRKVLENATSYQEAVAQLSSTKLIAAAYFVVGGINPGEGVIITMKRTAEPADLYFLDQNSSRWYVLETNYDRWTTPPPEDDRRSIGMKAMDDLGQDKLNGETLLTVLDTNGTLNKLTVMTTIMRAADPSVYKSWIRYDTENPHVSNANHEKQGYFLTLSFLVVIKYVTGFTLDN